MRTNIASVVASILVASIAAATSAASADDTSQEAIGVAVPSATSVPQATIHTQAPTPETLASQLFPPRYRGMQSAPAIDDPQFSMLIRFGFDSTDILPESEPMLESVGEMLGMDSVRARSVVIEGHTDALGTEAYNQDLSERRARRIKQYLVERFGVAPKRLVTLGKGERELLAANEPAAPIQRRVTFRPARKVILK